MARSRSPSPKPWEKHPGTYAKTSDTWTTRYYNRKQDPMRVLMGLDTSPDDYGKKEGSSPYLTNVRYRSEREKGQRAPVMSRRGSLHLVTIGEDNLPRQQSDGAAYLEVREGKVIERTVLHSKLLTGVSLYLQNPQETRGALRITVRDTNSKREFVNAVVDAETIGSKTFGYHELRFIRAVRDSQVTVRLEMIDVPTEDLDKPLRILAETNGVHQFANHDIPNNDEALRETPYEFREAPLAPLVGLLVNDWTPIPRAEDFMYNGQLHVAFPVRHDGVVEVWMTNLETNVTTLMTGNVDHRAEAVRFAQAEGYLYRVDGYSPLRRTNLTTLNDEDAIPKQDDITIPDVNPETLTAKPGASLIYVLGGNRMFLSGFKDDPNLVINSLIDEVKPRFQQFNDRFYSPDQSPELSAGSPVTALEGIGGMVIVWRIDGLSLYDYGSAGGALNATQITPEGQIGVLNQEAVCKGKNNIYFYNPVEGVCRFAGSTYYPVSGDIDNWLERIKHKDGVFMLYHNQRVRMYFSFEDEVPDSCFYYYTEMTNQSQAPWYRDKNTLVSSAVVPKDSKTIYAIHSQVASVMELDKALADFDSIIELEYHTQYRIPTTSSPNGETIVRRLHVHEIASSAHSLYIGLDTDHHNRPIVYRKLIEEHAEPQENPDAIFPEVAEVGGIVISIPMYVRCRQYQVRVKRYCYKDVAEIQSFATEYSNKDAI